MTEGAPQTTVEDTSWFEKADCKGQGKLFYPPVYSDFVEYKEDRIVREGRAKAICGECAVKSQCLDYAVSHKERLGIWGGMTEEERKKIRSIPKSR